VVVIKRLILKLIIIMKNLKLLFKIIYEQSINQNPTGKDIINLNTKFLKTLLELLYI